ncbi:MAG: polysaccharide deacetylase family protein [Armatimonadetes bacterium]|nr:polysaccharide deacetylase family protein [Armatimonadota bacterium]
MATRTATLICAALLLVGCAPKPEPVTAPVVKREVYKPKPADEQRKFVRPQFRKTVILVYHDMVLKRDKDALWFDCTPAELTKQIEEMEKKGVKFVSLAAVEDELFGGAQPQGPQVAITFADNYLGFAKYGWPILRKRSIPVTMFVHTDFVGDTHGRPKLPWFRLLEFGRFQIASVQSQTCSHPEDITKLTDKELKHEMEDSKKELLDKLGFQVPYIAYPNGKYDERVMAAAKAAGYRMGFTEAQKPVEAATDPMAVPRYVHTKWKQALADIGVQ